MKAVNAVRDQIGMPASIQTSFQGTARRSKASLQNEWLLIMAAHRDGVYRAGGFVRELHPSDHDSFDAALGGGGGAAVADVCCHDDFSVIALIGIILLMGIVKKNAIMMIDFALEAQRQRERSRLTRFIRRVCCGFGRS